MLEKLKRGKVAPVGRRRGAVNAADLDKIRRESIMIEKEDLK